MSLESIRAAKELELLSEAIKFGNASRFESAAICRHNFDAGVAGRD